jgi:SAM-dependent methyltransferase
MSGFDPRKYWEERLTRNFGLHGVGYIGLGGPYNDWLYRVRRHVFRRIAAFLPFDPASSSVMDLGSGTGFYVEQWREIGVRRITGIDLTAVAVERLRRRFPESEFHQLDIAGGGPFPGSPYDVISAFDVLFHIVDDDAYRRALAAVSESLRPGGWLLLSENFLHRPTVRAEHVVSRSAPEIEAALRQAGLEVVRRGPMFVLMNYPVDAKAAAGHLWSAMTLPVRAHRGLGRITGFLLGAALYLPELLLTRILRESPSTEYAVCRKLLPGNRPSD